MLKQPHLKLRIQTELPPHFSPAALPPDAQFFTSGDTQHATRIMSHLWGQPVKVAALPAAFC